MNKILIHLFLLLCFADSWARTVQIHGMASERTSGIVYVYKYSDAFTSQRVILAESDIQENGAFTFTFELDKTCQIFLMINRVSASMYMHPGEKYDVVFPDEKHIVFRSFSASRIPLIIEPKQNLTDTLNDIDSTIAEFVNAQFFDYAYQQFRGPESFIEQARKRYPDADLFKMSADSDTSEARDIQAIDSSFNALSAQMSIRYGMRGSQYTRDYLRYSMAELELMTLPSFSSFYEHHFAHEPVQLSNVAYVRAFRAFFHGFLDKRFIEANHVLPDTKEGLFSKLDSMLGVGSPELFAGIWILHVLNTRGLWSETANGKNPILEELILKSEMPAEIIAAAKGLKRQATFVSAGRRIGTLVMSDGIGDRWKLEDEPNGYKYFLFFAQWNSESLKELTLLEKLSEKMNGMVRCYAVCCDADFISFKKYLSASQKSPVTYLYAGCNPLIDDECALKLIPDALFLDENNKTMMPHTPLPSGRLEEYFKRITDDNKRPVKGRKSWNN